MRLLKGTIICLVEGAYSDETVEGLFRVLKDFETEEVEAAFADVADMVKTPQFGDSREPIASKGYEKWLVEKGYVEPIVGVQYSMGTYGYFDPHTQEI